MKKLLLTLFGLLFLNLGFAQNYTLLPQGQRDLIKNPIVCRSIMNEFYTIYQSKIDNSDNKKDYNTIARYDAAVKCLSSNLRSSPATDVVITTTDSFECKEGDTEQQIKRDDILACAVVSGKFDIVLVKPVLEYVLKLVSVISGSIAILFIILGGYQYFQGVITGDVTEAKGTIKNAILGLIVATSAWIIVDLVVTLFTIT